MCETLCRTTFAPGLVGFAEGGPCMPLAQDSTLRPRSGLIRTSASSESLLGFRASPTSAGLARFCLASTMRLPRSVYPRRGC